LFYLAAETDRDGALGFAGGACFEEHATIPALSVPIKDIGTVQGAAGRDRSRRQ
jgi:hypothetical protein